MLAPKTKVRYSLSGIREILRSDDDMRQASFEKAWEARNKYFEPLPDDPDFDASSLSDDGAARERSSRNGSLPSVGITSTVDQENLTNLLLSVQRSQEEMAASLAHITESVSILFSRLSVLETAHHTGAGSTAVEVIPDEDLMMGSQ